MYNHPISRHHQFQFPLGYSKSTEALILMKVFDYTVTQKYILPLMPGPDKI